MGFLRGTLFVFLMALAVNSAWAKKSVGFVDFVNPIPKFSSFGFDPEELANIVGEGQIILTLPATEAEIWTKGKIKHYQGVRFPVTVSVIDGSVEKVRKSVMDVTAMETFMPQITDSSVVLREGNRYMAEFTQSYKLPLLSLEATFHLQHDVEEKGDISFLLHKGDIDAGIGRWEFFPIAENRTLVAYSFWGDMASAGLAFKIILSAQPELKDSMGPIASAMVLQQLKDYVEGEEVVEKKRGALTLKTRKGAVPLFARNAFSMDSLERLADVGTLMFIYPRQPVIDVDGEEDDLQFVSAISFIPAPVDKVRPIAADYQTVPEYFNWAKKVKVTPLPEEGQENVWMKLRLNMGPIFISIKNDMNTEWLDQNTMVFEETKDSDMSPSAGGWEFIPFKNGEQTMMVFTQGAKIGDNASFFVRVMRGIPLSDLIISMHSAITIIEKQRPWLLEKLGISDNAEHVVAVEE